MPTAAEAFNRVSNYYSALAYRYFNRSDLMDIEFAQIQQVFPWLLRNNEPQYLQLLNNLSSYLQTRSLYGLLLNYCHIALEIAARLTVNPGRLFLLTSDALFSLGEWDKASISIQKALTITQEDDPATHAYATLALGRMQINRGEYRSALRTLKTAEELFRALSDVPGVATAKSEVAAHLLVKGEFKQALKLYLEIKDMLEAHGKPADQPLFMLGVVYRRLGQNRESFRYLNAAYEHARIQNNRGAMATALHHLAWIYYDQHQWVQAKQIGMQAKLVYNEIKNPRGASDVDEQLGLIAFHEKDLESARGYLEQALATRLKLGNQPGAASTIRRLARIYLQSRQVISSFQYYLRGFMMYARMRVLSRKRIIGVLRSPFTNDI